MTTAPDVLIIGAGLAGLCCARRLHEAGVSFQLLEASDGVGGRVRTDEHEGFLLDRGFQVFFTAYPEAQRVLDYAALDLKPFFHGAQVWFAGHFSRVADPWRVPGQWKIALRSDVAPLTDKLRLARLRRRLARTPVDDLFRRPERTAREAIHAEGFSELTIRRFFRPLFAGVLLDKELRVSSRLYELAFKMMATGEVCLPARGMGAIPAQLAAGLPPGSIRLGARVDALRDNGLSLESGEHLAARAVVVAVEGPEASRLVGEIPPVASRSVTCFYYAADQPPLAEPILVLNGDGIGTVNNMAVLSGVAPGYAPPGQSLVSVTALGTHNLTDAQLGGFLLAQLQEWFGPQVRGWRFLRSYRIPHALPEQLPGSLDPPARPARIRPGLYVCGDHCASASINGAMLSGRLAAESLLEDLSR